MSRPSAVPPEEKTRLVLSVLAGEMSVAEAARKVSEQSMSNWKRQFIEAGRNGVAEGGRPGPNSKAGHVSIPNGLGLEHPDETGTNQRVGVAPNELTELGWEDELAGTPWHKHVPARIDKLPAAV